MNEHLPGYIAWTRQNWRCVFWYVIARTLLFLSDAIAVPRRWAFSHWRAAEIELGRQFPELDD